MRAERTDRVLHAIDDVLDVGTQRTTESVMQVPPEGTCISCGHPAAEGSSWCSVHRVAPPIAAEIEALIAVMTPALEAMGAALAEVLATVADIVEGNPELIEWAARLNRRVESVGESGAELGQLVDRQPAPCIFDRELMEHISSLADVEVGLHGELVGPLPDTPRLVASAGVLGSPFRLTYAGPRGTARLDLDDIVERHDLAAWLRNSPFARLHPVIVEDMAAMLENHEEIWL